MAKIIGWASPIETAGEHQGFNDAAINTFTKSRLEALAKEPPQNSLDARLGEAPVHIEYQVITLRRDQFPDVEQFKRVLDACAAVEGEGPKAKEFFDKAIALLDGEEIDVLQISDYNTTGLAGPDTRGNPFHTFLKADGTSQKQSDTAGGSFGIGRKATFTVSDLRSILVSTVFKSGDDYCFLTQGKSILISHEVDGETRKGNVYWGNTKSFGALSEVPEDYPWLGRGAGEYGPENRGLTVSILGFHKRPDWEKIVAGYIARTYMVAIENGDLTAKVGEIEINRSTIEAIVRNNEIATLVGDDQDNKSAFKPVRAYYHALTSSRTVIEEAELGTLGRVRAKILVGVDLPKSVAFFRNGMFITDKLPGLAHKFGNSVKPFACIFEAMDHKGNELLRAMEPPAHDSFNPDLLEGRKEEGKKALWQIAEFIRATIKKYAEPKPSENDNVSEISEYLADESDDLDNSDEGDINPDGIMTIIDETEIIRSGGRKSGQVVSGYVDVDGDEQVSAGGNGGTKEDVDEPRDNPENHGTDEENVSGHGVSRQGTAGKGDANVESGEGQKKLVRMKLPHRGIMMGTKRYKIELNPSEPVTVELEFKRVGLYENHPLKVVAATAGEVRDGKVLAEVCPNNRYLEVAFENDFRGSVRMTANAI